MKKYLVMVVAACLVGGCEKDGGEEDNGDFVCKNVSYNVNDPMVALVTSVSSPATAIVKIQNGTITTAAYASGFEFWGPAISPDKQKFICFRSPTGNADQVNDYNNAELWMFDIDGSNGHMVTTCPLQGWTAMGMADWAPDGNHIVLAAQQNETSDGGNPHWSIFVTDTTGATAVKVNTRLGYFSHPRFANGNMNLVTYTAWPNGLVNGGELSDCEIHYASIDAAFQTTSETRATNDALYDYSPSFSPDNSKICYSKETSSAANTPVQVYKHDVSTGTNNILISNNKFNTNPYWCATNNTIYFSHKTEFICMRLIMGVDENGANGSTLYQGVNQHYYDITVR